jgi:4-amino-4-deoxy-L-arabinose transferase-like glycosyltransferase
MDAKGRSGGIPYFLAFQALLGSLTALLIALLGWRLCHSRGVFYFLLPVSTFWGPSLGLAPCVMTETTFVFLFVASALVLLEAFRSKRYILFGIAGILVGLASLARPILYPLYFLLAVAWPWLFRKKDKVPTRKKRYTAILFFAVLLIVIVPWMVRNTKINGRVTLITSSVGLNLVMRNTDATRPEVWKELMDQSVPGGSLSGIDEATRDRKLAGRALKEILDHPGQFFASVLDRLIHLFNGSMDNFPDLKIPLAWHHWAMVPLIIGLFALFLTRPSEGLLLVILELNFILIYCLTFFEARFRETMVPIHLVLACLGVLFLVRKTRASFLRKKKPGPDEESFEDQSDEEERDEEKSNF